MLQQNMCYVSYFYAFWKVKFFLGDCVIIVVLTSDQIVVSLQENLGASDYSALHLGNFGKECCLINFKSGSHLSSLSGLLLLLRDYDDHREINPYPIGSHFLAERQRARTHISGGERRSRD